MKFQFFDSKLLFHFICDLKTIEKLMKDIREAFVQIKGNPNAFSRFDYEKELKHEYRKKVVNGYVILYWIDEKTKVVTVSFIFHTKMNYRTRLL